MVVWLHNGQEVVKSEDFQFLQEGRECTLMIQEVFPEDTGEYACHAHNAHGHTRTHALLTVHGNTLLLTNINAYIYMYVASIVCLGQ